MERENWLSTVAHWPPHMSPLPNHTRKINSSNFKDVILERVQLVKDMLCKPKDLSLIPRMHVFCFFPCLFCFLKKPCIVVYNCNPGSRKGGIVRCLGLGGEPA